MAIVVIAVVSFSLILGAVWGIYGKMSDRTEGFLVALARRSSYCFSNS